MTSASDQESQQDRERRIARLMVAAALRSTTAAIGDTENCVDETDIDETLSADDSNLCSGGCKGS